MQRTEDASFYSEGDHSSPAIDQHLMEEWLDRAGTIVTARRGGVLDGTIVSVSPAEILIDIGCKADGLVSGRELERMTPEEFAEICVGDCIPVFVVNPEDRDGNVVLSINRARAQRDWRTAQKLFESEEVFEGNVSGCNKGGVIVNIGRLRGFVPASQLTPGVYRYVNETASRDDDSRWEQLIGHKLKLKVIEIDRNRNRLILSERAAARESRQETKQKLLEELQVGETRNGVVASICHFGAFVDLGGADGLVHLSEISWNRVEHPKDVLKVGQEVEVHILDVDREKERIGLSIRRLAPEPWDDVTNNFVVGQIVDGTVAKVVNFGAFARIGDCVEGLIHISELSEARINHPHEVVKEGDVVPLKVIRIDTDQRRIGLSLIQARDEVELDWQEELEESQEADETVEIA